MANVKALLFDLDGTIVQTRKASWQVFQETNDAFDLGLGTPQEFYNLFQGKFYDSLEEIANSRGIANPEEVREHFQTQLRESYTPEVVPGMVAVIRALASDYKLMLLSANSMEVVRRILVSNGIAECFSNVFSGEIAPRKGDVIHQVLSDASYASGRSCLPYYDDAPRSIHNCPAELMLITDTVGDVKEGKDAGIRVCGVMWGMHATEELEEAGAEFVCVWPEELLAYLKPEGTCSRGVCVLPPAIKPNLCNEVSVPRNAILGQEIIESANSTAESRRARRLGAAKRQAVLIEDLELVEHIGGATEVVGGAGLLEECCCQLDDLPTHNSSGKRGECSTHGSNHSTSTTGSTRIPSRSQDRLLLRALELIGS